MGGIIDPLSDPRSDNVKRAAIRFGIRDALPHLSSQLISRAITDYKNLKQFLVSSNAYSEAGVGHSEEPMILQTQDGESARGGRILGQTHAHTA